MGRPSQGAYGTFEIDVGHDIEEPVPIVIDLREPANSNSSGFWRGRKTNTDPIDVDDPKAEPASDYSGPNVEKTPNASLGRYIDSESPEDSNIALSFVNHVLDLTKTRLRRTDSHFIDLQKAGSGVMVAFFIPHEIATQLAIPGGEELHDLHVTLAYMGKDVDPEAIEKMTKALIAFGQKHPPMLSRISGIGMFNATDNSDGKQPLHATFDAPALPDFRQELVKVIEKAGVPVAKTFGYSPHITLAYVDEGKEWSSYFQNMPEMERFTIPAMTLAVAGRRILIPLTGGTDTVEKLSALEHEQWMSWSKDLVENGQVDEETARRWKMLWVSYDELSEDQKDKDREWGKRAAEIAGVKKALKGIKHPKDHDIGVVVPKGGASCANCKWAADTGEHCAHDLFIEWNGTSELPAPADEYCCDFWDPSSESGVKEGTLTKTLYLVTKAIGTKDRSEKTKNAPDPKKNNAQTVDGKGRRRYDYSAGRGSIHRNNATAQSPGGEEDLAAHPGDNLIETLARVTRTSPGAIKRLARRFSTSDKFRRHFLARFGKLTKKHGIRNHHLEVIHDASQTQKSDVSFVVNLDKADIVDGGLDTDYLDPSEFDPDDLEDGTRIEHEVLGDLEAARDIAMENLTRDPLYYKKWRHMIASPSLEEDYA